MRRSLLGIVSTLTVLASSLVLLVTAAPPAAAAPGDPFDPADSIVFVAQNVPTQLFRAVPDASGTVVFQPEGPVSPINYNAIAYNPADDYVWGIKTSNPAGSSGPASWPLGSIIRIGEGGVMTRVGTSSVGSGQIVGAFGGDGFFYVGTSGNTAMYRIHPVTGAIANTYTLPATTGAPDLAYANGYFWGVNAAGDVVRVLLGPAPQVTTFPSPVPAGGYGAAWTFGNGNLGFSNNVTGQVVQLAVTDPAGTPSFSIVSTQPGPASGNNDGGASPGLPTDLAIAKAGPTPLLPGAQATYTLTVTNNGPGNASGYVVTDTVPAPLVNVASPTPGCTVAGSTVTCTGGRLEVGQSAQITITADVPAGQYLCVTNAASVLGNEADPVSANDTARVESCPEAGLSLVKSTDETVIDTPGQIVTYDLVVTNTGPVTVTDIAVADPLAEPVTCPLTALGPGQSMTCTADHVVTQLELDSGGPLVNVATATGEGPGGPVPPAESPPVEVPVTQVPGLTLTKSADPVDALPAVDELVTYTFLALNTGNVTLTDVTITDPMEGLSALDCDLPLPATLEPAGHVTCIATYAVTQDDVDDGTLTNTATATGTPPAGEPIEATDTVSVPADQVPGIDLAKRADRSSVDTAGEVITYTLTVTNTGNVTLAGVTVADPMDGLSPLDCIQPAQLVPGQQLICTATYEVTQDDLDAGGTLVNTATATGTPPAGEDVTGGSPPVEVPIEQEPALNLQKTATPGQVLAAEDVITYTLTATNTGNVTLAGVEIADPLPELSELDCDLAVPATLAPGDVLTCTATYEVSQDDIDGGGVTNVAGATGTPPTGPPVEVPSPPVTVEAVPEPSLTLTKTSDAEPYGVGDVVAYDFLVANTGNTTIIGVIVEDPLLDAPAECPATELAPEESMTCTGARTATQADVDAGELVNTATAQGVPPNGQRITSPPSTVTVPSAPHAPGLSVVKTADRDTFAEVGEVVGFSFEVTNTGNVTITGIVVDDDLLDAPATCPGTQLAPAETMTCTGSRAITEAEVAAGELVNTASASGTTPSGETLVSAADTVRVAYEPPPDPPSPPAGPGAPPATGGGSLPYTGSDAAGLVQLALGLVVVGLLARRARRQLA